MPYARAEVKLKHLPLCFLTFIRLALWNQAKEQINVVGPILSMTCLLATDFHNDFFPPHNPWISKIFYHHHQLAEVCISRRKPVHRSQNRERKIHRDLECADLHRNPHHLHCQLIAATPMASLLSSWSIRPHIPCLQTRHTMQGVRHEELGKVFFLFFDKTACAKSDESPFSCIKVMLLLQSTGPLIQKFPKTYLPFFKKIIMKKRSLKIQYTLLTKILQDFSISDRQPLWKTAAHQSTPKDGNVATIQRVTGHKHPARSVLENTEEQPTAPAL